MFGVGSVRLNVKPGTDGGVRIGRAGSAGSAGIPTFGVGSDKERGKPGTLGGVSVGSAGNEGKAGMPRFGVGREKLQLLMQQRSAPQLMGSRQAETLFLRPGCTQCHHQ